MATYTSVVVDMTLEEAERLVASLSGHIAAAQRGIRDAIAARGQR